MIRFVLVVTASLACAVAGTVPVAAKGPAARPGPPPEPAAGDLPAIGRVLAGIPGGAGPGAGQARGHRPASGTGGPGADGQWPDIGWPDLGDLRDLGDLGDLGNLGVVGSDGLGDASRAHTPPASGPTHGGPGPSRLRGIWPTTEDLRHKGAQIFRGWGFDVCSAPPLETMRAWDESRYGAIGVYIGGSSRSCPQEHLTRSWVREVTRMGWRLLPVYVGAQSSCATARRHREHVIDEDHLDRQARVEAEDAVESAEDLGMARNTPIYLDMESYQTRHEECTRPVIDFTQAWSRRVRARGYLPGFYSNANAGIREIERARRDGHSDLPDLLWFARWGVEPRIYGEPELTADAWGPHRRIHQFAGDRRETHGGVTMVIDRDLVDAPVAIVEDSGDRSVIRRRPGIDIPAFRLAPDRPHPAPRRSPDRPHPAVRPAPGRGRPAAHARPHSRRRR